MKFLKTILLILITFHTITAQYCATRSHALGGGGGCDYSLPLNATTYTIPVVFHLLGSNAQQYSDLDLQEMIDEVNYNFNNPTSPTMEGESVFVSLDFQIAKSSPENECTSGITRFPDVEESIDISNFSSYNLSVDPYYWDTEEKKYLNIYIVSNIIGGGSNVLGFGTFPSTSDNWTQSVILRSGNANSSILTHEIGHWLSLYHTFMYQNSPLGPPFNDPCSKVLSFYFDLQSDDPQFEYGDFICDTNPAIYRMYDSDIVNCDSPPQPLYDSWDSHFTWLFEPQLDDFNACLDSENLPPLTDDLAIDVFGTTLAFPFPFEIGKYLEYVGFNKNAFITNDYPVDNFMSYTEKCFSTFTYQQYARMYSEGLSTLYRDDYYTQANLEITLNYPCSLVSSVIPNFSLSTDLTISNQCLTVPENTELLINNHLTIKDNSDIKFLNGASLRIANGGKLTIKDSELQGCGNKWVGIILDEGAEVDMENSIIRDAGKGINSSGTTILTLNNSQFLDCEYGLHLTGKPSIRDFNGNNFENALMGVFAVDCPQFLLNLAKDKTGLPNTFSNNTFGIYLLRSTANISHNVFDGGLIGIRLISTFGTHIFKNTLGNMHTAINGSSALSTSMTSNEIGQNNDRPEIAIDLSMSNWCYFSKNNIDVDRFGVRAYTSHYNIYQDINNIHVHSNTTAPSHGVSYTLSSSCYFKNLNITGDGCNSGIDINGGRNHFVENNEIYIDYNHSTSAGIRLLGGANNVRINANIVTNTSFAKGITLRNSNGNEIWCNDINVNSDAIRIDQNSQGQDIVTNLIQGSNDLFILSELGRQIDHGNEFYGGFTWAIGLSIMELQNSRFDVTNTSPFMPSNPFPGINAWFFPSDFSPEICNQNPGNNYIPFYNPNDLCSYLVRLDALQNTDYNAYFIRLIHLMNYYENNSSLNEPACLTNYLNSSTLCGLFELHTSINFLLNSETHSTNQLNVFSNVVTQVQDYYEDGSYDADKSLDYNLLINELASVPSEGDNGDPLIPINSILNNLSCTTAIASMWQQSLVNYLVVMESETISNSLQIENDILSVICDIDYGDAVNWNRSIASRYSMQDFELMDYCNENPESEFRSKVIKVKDVSIYPNPSTGLITINIPKDEIISELQIQDIQGKNIYQSNNIINNLFNLNVNGAPGLYIVRMKFEDGDSIIKKLVIQ